MPATAYVYSLDRVFNFPVKTQSLMFSTRIVTEKNLSETICCKLKYISSGIVVRHTVLE